MSVIALTEFSLGLPPDSGEQPWFPNGERVFIDIFRGEDATGFLDRTTPPILKIGGFGPLKQDPNTLFWTTEESFEVPQDVRSLSIAVLVGNPKYGSIQVGRIELDTNYLQDISLRRDNRFSKVLVPTSNSMSLSISSVVCICIPLDEKPSPNVGSSDWVPSQDDSEEACRLFEVGKYFLRRFLRLGDLGDINKAISHHEHAVRLTPDGHANKPDRLYNLVNSFLGRFRHSGNLMGMDQAIYYHKHAMCLTPGCHADKAIHLNNLGNLFARRFEQSGDLMDIHKAISHHEHAVHLTPDGHADKPCRLNSLGGSFLSRFEHSGDLMDIHKAISHHEHAVRLTPDGHPCQCGHLNNLGNSFARQFEHSGDLMDINKAISHHEHAARLTPDDHADKPGRLNNLGNLFLHRFDHSGDLMDIDKAISHHEHAVRLTPDGHVDKASHLNHLGNLFVRQFQRSGDLMDINKAISHHEHAVCLTPYGHPDQPWYLKNLGNSFFRRFSHSGDLMDINKAISHYEHAVCLTPDSHADKPCRLNNLGNSFLSRFEHSGDLMDIHKAISHHEHAVRLTPDGHACQSGHLNNLGNSFACQFEHSGDLMDINKAISHHEHAVRLTPDGHADKPGRLNNLGSSFARLFERSGNLMDIDKAISHHEHAVRLTPDDHADKPGCLNNLGNSFSNRFKHSGDLMDIDNAISYHEHAVRLTPDGHTDKPGRLNNFGYSFTCRFEHSGDMMDIDKAISHHERAVHLTPDRHAHKPTYLNNLGSSFLRRFTRSRDLMDIDKAISHHEHTVRLTPDGHAKKPCHLNNLGNSFLGRFQHSGDLMDIDKAISHHEHAVHLTPIGQACQPDHLNNLGDSFLGRFQRSGDLMDIDKAISHHEHAVCLTPDGHTNKPRYLQSLGNSFFHRFEHAAHASDLHKAILSFKSSATSVAGPPHTMFQSALNWARLSRDFDLSQSFLACSTALSLIPRVTWLGESLSARYQHLGCIGSLATQAAATAIAFERPDIALEWLEQGRSNIWGQLLNLRTPVDDLRKVDQNLADDLVSTSRALENASVCNTTSNELISLEQAAQYHRRLAEKWENLLKSARMLPGFEDFLLPKKLSTLLKAAKSGPVVVINVHESRSDALILLAGLDDVIHIPLDSFYDKAQKLQHLLNDELCRAGMRLRDMERVGQLAPVNINNRTFEVVLSSLWTDIVEPVLNGLAFDPSSTPDLPRIWWCPTGPLTFLPIHAAGLYDPSCPGSNIFDFVVSSYTPTVTSLLEAFRETPKMFKGLLGVSQSKTLPNAEKEVKIIKQFESLKIHDLPGELATVDRVLDGMENSSWVHLACHAIQHTGSCSLTESAFQLHNGNLKLSTIITKSFPNADFAFLSACQTATGTPMLPDQALHLAAGMLTAGYRSVIATMWSIRDADAPLIAGEVYPHLVREQVPDSTMAAHALHHAVKQLRRKLGNDGFLYWVPFIHVGK